MAWFLIETLYNPEKYLDVRPRHRDFLLGLVAQGRVAFTGPFADDSGAAMLLQADDLEALHEMIDSDPYHLEGALAERTIREFLPVLGAWVPA